MRLFEKHFCLLILLLTLPLLFLPKINLISVESETAGIRIDDVILFFLGILVMWAHLLLQKKLDEGEKWVLAITLFSFFSFISNRLLFAMGYIPLEAKIFYTMRLFEYFLFFYVGTFAAQIVGNSWLIRTFFLVNFLLMTLQKLGLAGGMTVEGYFFDVSSRVQGIASFPSEMGLLLNLLFCYMIYDNDSKSRILKLFVPSLRSIFSKFYLYWMFCLFGIFVIFTGNRISILALLICFLFKLKSEINFKSMASWVVILITTSALIAGIIFLISQTEAVYNRSADLFSWRNLELVKIVWNKIDLSKDPITNEVIASDNYDVSWWLRIHKWMYVLKAYFSLPQCYLQGLGPGFAWSALDGGWLRILVEYGLIGSMLFWRFFSFLYRINIQLKWMMIAFGINMIFFDAYLAYKTMSFLLFTAGYAKVRQQYLQSSEDSENLRRISSRLASSNIS